MTFFFSFAILSGVIEYSVLEKVSLPAKTTFWKTLVVGWLLVVGNWLLESCDPTIPKYFNSRPRNKNKYMFSNFGCWLVVGCWLLVSWDPAIPKYCTSRPRNKDKYFF